MYVALLVLLQRDASLPQFDATLRVCIHLEVIIVDTILPSVLWSHVAVVERRTCSEVLVGNDPALHAQRRDALSCRQREQIQTLALFD